GNLRQFEGLRLRIHEFLTRLAARIEPRTNCFRLTLGPLFERHDSLVGCTQTIIRNRQNRGVNMSFVLIEDLDDVAVRQRIHDLAETLHVTNIVHLLDQYWSELTTLNVLSARGSKNKTIPEMTPARESSSPAGVLLGARLVASLTWCLLRRDSRH